MSQDGSGFHLLAAQQGMIALPGALDLDAEDDEVREEIGQRVHVGPAIGEDACHLLVGEVAAVPAALSEGSLFPYDFGFVHSILGEDGDPLDILVLLNVPLPVGCLLSARPLGVIEAEQRERGGKAERNDRLLAVATKARTHAHVHRLEDLRPGLLDEVEAFFGHYSALSGQRFTPLGRGGHERARALAEAGIVARKKGV